MGADRHNFWHGSGDDSSYGEGIGMKIKLWLEHEYEATYYEDNDGNVRLEVLTRPDSNQNEIPRLTTVDQIKAQAELENAVEQRLIDKAAEIAERRQVAGDARRERLRDDKMTGDAR